MHDRALYELLEAFTSETAAALAGERTAGAEIPFEVVETETRRGRPPLYCYRALTEQFIERRMGMLSGLASYAPAARALADRERIGSYLSLRGIGRVPSQARERADTALLTFLARVFGDRSDFELDRDRFQAAYDELEQALLDGQAAALLIVPLLGLGFADRTWQLELGDGLSLIRGDRLPDAPPEAVWDIAGEAQVLAVLSLTQERDRPAPVAAARRRFRRLLTAIRLFEHGRFGLGPLGWFRIDFGPWRPAALGTSGWDLWTPDGYGEGLPAGERTILAALQEDELRGFWTLMGRRLPSLAAGDFGSPELAWALARFEMGCQRSDPLETLSDHLLALRGLLEPEGPESGRLSQRVSLLCARPEARVQTAERVVEALSLERSVITGSLSRADEADELAQEVGEHLRALLRDVLCGHLASDLVGVAETVLAEELAASPA